MSIGRGFQGYMGYVASGLLGVHRDPTKWIALKEPPTITPEIVDIESRVFTAGAYHQSMEKLQGLFNCTVSFTMVYHPEEGIEFLKGILGSVTATELTGAGSGIYEHEFIGQDTIPMTEGFSLLVDYDIETCYVSGFIPTSAEFKSEVGSEVLVTINGIAKKFEWAAGGTSGTSQAQNALSFNVTITEDSNDDFKLAVDGGTAYECTIAAGTYSTAASLQAAINDAIEAQTSLNDDDGVPEVACYIDSDNKVNFYTTDKGTGAEVTWTAGTNDANTDLGYGTPVEAAGTATLGTASYSSVQPFMAHQLSVLQDSTTIYLSGFTAMIDTKLVGRNVLGHKYIKEPKFDGKREVTLTLTKEYEDDNAYDLWAANTNVDFEVNLRTYTEIVASSGVYYDCDMYFKRCRILNTPAPTFNGQAAITQQIPAKSYYYDSTYQDVKIDVNNTMATIPAAGNI